MFWRLGFAQQSPVDLLLETGDFTLNQLLDEDDLIQECKQLNKKLVEFLANPEQLETLLDYIVNEPPADGSDKEKFIYPYKSSEVLACDMTQVNDLLLSSPDMITRLLSILQRPAPLEPMPAGYFCKVMISLLARRPAEMLTIIKEHKVVPMLLEHLGASSILDLLLKAVQEAEIMSTQRNSSFGQVMQSEDMLSFGRTESRSSNEASNERDMDRADGEVDIDWLMTLNVVDLLVDKFDPGASPEVHANAAAALVGLLGSQNQSNPFGGSPTPLGSKHLGSQLLEPASSSKLLEKTFRSGSSSILEHGVSVLVEVVCICTQNSPLTCGEGDLTASMQATIRAIVDRLSDLINVLQSPPAMPAIINTTGKLDPPLGCIRMKVVDLLHALVLTGDAVVEQKIIESKALSVVMDLFFKYEWCNILHNTVKSMVDEILAGDKSSMKKCVIADCSLLARIITAHQPEGDGKVRSKGYTGHLRLISNRIEELGDSEDWLAQLVKGGEWREFADGYLQTSNDINDRRKLGQSTDTGRDSPHSLSLDLGDGGQAGSFEFRVNLLNEQLFATDDDGDVEGVGVEQDIEAGPIEEFEEAEGDSSSSPTRGQGGAGGSPQKEASPKKGSPTKGQGGGSPSGGSPKKSGGGSPKKGGGGAGAGGGAAADDAGLLAKMFINLTLVNGKAVADVKINAV